MIIAVTGKRIKEDWNNDRGDTREGVRHCKDGGI